MVTFWELAPSPNNTKVRMALRFKGIDFEAIPVDPFDRVPVIEASGQELTPVIADRGIVLNDSEAIIQFLDASYKETPRLFPAERAGRKECEAWKKTLDSKIAAFWQPVFWNTIKQEPVDESSRKNFEQGLCRLEETLRDDGTFMGPEMPICDLRVAEWATYAFPGASLIERVPLFAKFKESFAITEGRLPKLETFLKPWQRHLA